ncbi:MAG: hypothetical protein JXR48_17180 [Candidatus Delongbacteria bacterium]|nr:hypothetical protein [Candidatus Delongbacteria bacterium]MBN2836692.1 hypothetical protein [Candidatus Delongbacteria bacterium]
MLKVALILLIVNLVFSSGSFRLSNDKDTVERSIYPTPIQENRVHKAGLLWLNTTNYGIFGQSYITSANGGDEPILIDKCTGLEAPSAEMPGGSGFEFLHTGSLWFGGYLDSITIDQGKVFQGPLVSTGWSGYGSITRELWPTGFKHPDLDGTLKESSNIDGKKNCHGEFVYSELATAEEQFFTSFTDKYTDRSYTGFDDYDNRGHIPLGLEIKSESYAWSYDYASKFVIFDYTIYNLNEQQKDIYDFFMAIFLDVDVGRKDGVIEEYNGDDIAGFMNTWKSYDEQTQSYVFNDLNIAWVADNDGRNYTGRFEDNTMSEPGSGASLDGARGVTAVKVLRSPSSDLKYSFNMFVSDDDDEKKDWGPRLRSEFHEDWGYDLSATQKGYDYSDYDQLGKTGGRTEGSPLGDKGRYMVMSNDEFDYDQHLLPYAGYWNWYEMNLLDWEPWNPNTDGSNADKMDLANGSDIKFLLSFGPLGSQEVVKMAIDEDYDNIYESSIDKNVWKFQYGDSLKLTMAFIVNDDFHVSTDQSSDVLDPSLYNWTDAINNVLWTQKVFDTPMFDTKVKGPNGVKKSDGFFGEDVGIDGEFASFVGEQCIWTETIYIGPDDGEGNFELDEFSYSMSWGSNEDNFLPKGNTSFVSDDIGTTSEYGYTISGENGETYRFGYNNGKLDSGDGVPDFTGPPPPPSPKLKTYYSGKDFVVEWRSDNYNSSGISPESFSDPFSKKQDFEGYQVWISNEMFTNTWVKIFEVDKDNYVYDNVQLSGYYLEDPIPHSLIIESPEQYPDIVESNNNYYRLIPFGENRDLKSNYISDPEGLWEYKAYAGYDSLIWTYRFTLKDLKILDKKYISVTSSDFGDVGNKTKPLHSNPDSNAELVNLSSLENKNNVIVVPNPYRVDKNYHQTSNWEGDPKNWDATKRKIAFYNIPKLSVIRIYTLAGDHVKTITHNSKSLGIEGDNICTWNLLNDNNQEVTSGVYLFHVENMNDSSYDFVGKFVIIK